ncbi:MAG: dihydropteroate synthase [Cytophagales bacterium]|nr:dihydropteroate synthase [Cytophagales bacterium]
MTKDTAFCIKKTLNAKGKALDLSTPAIMGILNVTPDSFFAGSRMQPGTELLAKAKKMVQDGAAILDIGGYSSRPGADDVSEEEESRRVCEAIAMLNKHLPEMPLSVDTFRASVAEQAVSAGASIINDISGGELDAQMFDTVAKLQVPYIMMHMRGTPQSMQQQTGYGNLMEDMLDFFHPKLTKLKQLGVNDVIIDPGFGFAKTLDQNYRLLRNMKQLHMLECLVLAGVSRKSMIYKLLDTSPEEALNGTTVLHTIALIQGASILRVHDVKEARECVRLFQKTFF